MRSAELLLVLGVILDTSSVASPFCTFLHHSLPLLGLTLFLSFGQLFGDHCVIFMNTSYIIDGKMYTISQVRHPEGIRLIPLGLLQPLPLGIRHMKTLSVNCLLCLKLSQML